VGENLFQRPYKKTRGEIRPPAEVGGGGLNHDGGDTEETLSVKPGRSVVMMCRRGGVIANLILKDLICGQDQVILITESVRRLPKLAGETGSIFMNGDGECRRQTGDNHEFPGSQKGGKKGSYWYRARSQACKGMVDVARCMWASKRTLSACQVIQKSDQQILQESLSFRNSRGKNNFQVLVTGTC